MKKIIKKYINTFSGLSKEVWWLALITLINRSGTMVIPFLSLYLTRGLGFELSDVGWVMSCFGLGSVIGSWLGGKLTDLIGSYKVMLFSLLSTGIMFVLLQIVETFIAFCTTITFLMIVADTFRPAMFVALGTYSKPENKTRSLTLIRLAINLGFSIGPAIGGVIITSIGYTGLFWADGITCVLAGILFLKVLHPKKARVLDEVKKLENPKSPYSDRNYWVFLIAMMLFGIVFLQYFSTMPIFYKREYNLTEFEIGLLLGMNGFLIFLLEMPLIKWLEESKYNKINLMLLGVMLLAISVIVLNTTSWIGVLIIGMILMTIGEMIVFPFSNAYAMQRAQRGKHGEYMALYSVSFSIAHIFGHNSGMQMVSKIGFSNTWTIIFSLGILSAFFILILKIITIQENKN